MAEEWKDVKGYEGVYQVSNMGRVKSLPRTRQCRTKDGLLTMRVSEKIMRQWKRSSYYLVDFWKDGKRDIRSVHVLVYEAFVGEVINKNFIHHMDKNKLNNCVDNLVQLSVLEHNRLHCCGRPSKFKGVTKNNERNRQMYVDFKNGLTREELIDKYKLSRSQINHMLFREKNNEKEGEPNS